MRTVERRFESYDWLKAIGGFVFLIAALLPWWEREYIGVPPIATTV